MARLAVFFPGIGYTQDKPLLYYSRRIAAECGYDIRILSYSGFPEKIRGDRRKMEASFRIALSQSEEMLSDLDLTSFEDVLFVGKSLGTIAAAKIASESAAKIRQIMYTPLEDTFLFQVRNAIAFTGAADPWVGMDNSRISLLCRERNIPCFVIPGANHSLESKDLLADLEHLQMVLRETRKFISEEPRKSSLQ